MEQINLQEVSANPDSPITHAAFTLLTEEEKKHPALEIFFLVRQDAGRDQNNPNVQASEKTEVHKKSSLASHLANLKWMRTFLAVSPSHFEFHMQ
jgi:hypothetical protein